MNKLDGNSMNIVNENIEKLKEIFHEVFSENKIDFEKLQEEWTRTKLRNWSEIYPQLSIFFSEIMEKYTK